MISVTRERYKQKRDTAIFSSSILLVIPVFCVSLLITMSAAAWFTHRLEAICVKLALPIGVLSLLGALGANIPNYAASIDAIAGGRLLVGLGIIIGSNIYNIAIILAVSTFGTSGRSGIVLAAREVKDVRTVGTYSLIGMLATLLELWLLPGTPLGAPLHAYFPLEATILLLAAIVLVLCIFCGQAIRILKRVHIQHHHALDDAGKTKPLPSDQEPIRVVAVEDEDAIASQVLPATTNWASRSLSRLMMEAVAALIIALTGVVVMVQSGQTLTNDLNMPPVIAGLLVLAVATSLPNTVVAFSLARDKRTTACIEEIFSSNSINVALGIALPLLFWQNMLNDRLLLFLDVPLMVILTGIAFGFVLRQQVSRLSASLLLLIYAAWIIMHIAL
jgi:cation:H+ antiporter